jgi:uncharacterized lipoprotein YbaY
VGDGVTVALDAGVAVGAALAVCAGEEVADCTPTAQPVAANNIAAAKTITKIVFIKLNIQLPHSAYFPLHQKTIKI